VDITTKMDLIGRRPTEEVITEQDLETLLTTKTVPVAYNGFEPSGLAHLGTGVVAALKCRDLTDAGCKFILFLADWHAWMNRKGSWEIIRRRAEYLKRVWLSLGVDPARTEFTLGSREYAKNPDDYWSKVIKVAESMTLSEAEDSLTVAGQKKKKEQPFSRLIYTPMQVADVFYLGVDICQLGIDQRRANILAREKGQKLTRENQWKPVGLAGKPVCVHHHLLMGLQGPGRMGYEADAELDKQISSKSSKSKPETSIFVHDSLEQIRTKMKAAFFEQGKPENPVMEICEYILMRTGKGSLTVHTRKEGDMHFESFVDLERAVLQSKIHPLDLKEAVSEALYEFLGPSRQYFSTNSEARQLLKERVLEERQEWEQKLETKEITKEALQRSLNALPKLDE